MYIGRRALAKPDRIDNTSAKARTPQGCRAQRSATLATLWATLEAAVGAVDVRFGGETVVIRCLSAVALCNTGNECLLATIMSPNGRIFVNIGFDQAYWPRSSIASWTHHLPRAAREVGVAPVVVTGSFSAVGHRLDDPSAPSDETLQVYPFERLMPIGGKA